jgi:nitroimidazol reductase NimA-like FMN-containing flavoprotein (pyridoxamine 5'-phosphate oxidase superfamily)
MSNRSLEPSAEPIEHSLAWDDPTQTRTTEVDPTPWERARSGLEQGRTFWLATLHPGGRPHVVPILAVMVDGVLHFCASDRSRKAKNLATDPHCAVTTSGDSLDLVVEGVAEAVTDNTTAQRVAAAYEAKYGWQPEARQEMLWGDGAPTAGPPPYRIYRVAPTTAFGFPTDDTTIPTRWSFAES